MEKDTFTIKYITPKDAFDLRSNFLRTPTMPPYHAFEGENLPSSLHLGAYDGNRIVSAVSFVQGKSDHFSQDKQYMMRAMVTDPDYRNKHAASIIIEEGIRELVKRGTEVVWFNARVYAIPFYEKNGFTVIGDEFMIPDVCMHKVMYKIL